MKLSATLTSDVTRCSSSSSSSSKSNSMVILPLTARRSAVRVVSYAYQSDRDVPANRYAGGVYLA